MKIWAHVLMRNEENFIWYAIMSMINHIDYMLIWDNSSEDSTQLIIKEILKNKSLAKKISYKIIPYDGEFREDLIRQKMLDETKSDWLILLDGDEIWWEDSIKKLVMLINKEGDRLDAIVVPTINLVGDVYHFQEERAGKYELLGKKGHLNVRAFNRRIPGLQSYGRNWNWGWVDLNNRYVTEANLYNLKFLDAPYLHATHLRRSREKQKVNKYKYELGNKFPRDFKYPEVFSKPRPDIVPSPWSEISGAALFKAGLLTPLRKVKRRIEVSFK